MRSSNSGGNSGSSGNRGNGSSSGGVEGGASREQDMSPRGWSSGGNRDLGGMGWRCGNVDDRHTPPRWRQLHTPKSAPQ